MRPPKDAPDPDGLIDPSTLVVARSDVASVELDGEIVLYDDGRRRLHRLNPTASTLWQCLDGSATLGEIAADMAEAYDVELTEVLPEVLSLTRSFAAEGLLEGLDPASVTEAPNH